MTSLSEARAHAPKEWLERTITMMNSVSLVPYWWDNGWIIQEAKDFLGEEFFVDGKVRLRKTWVQAPHGHNAMYDDDFFEKKDGESDGQ